MKPSRAITIFCTLLLWMCCSICKAEPEIVSGLVFSGNVENMALGDAPVTAPKLLSRQLSVDGAWCRWAPDGAVQNEFSGSAFIGAGHSLGINLLAKGINCSASESKELIAGGGISLKISDVFFVDATFKYASQTVQGASTIKAYCADAGLAWSDYGLTAGVKISNIGSKSAPTNAKAGISYLFSAAFRHRFQLSANAGYYFPEACRALVAGGGLEYSFNNRFFLRGGYHYSSETSRIPSFAGIGIGGRYNGFGLKATYLVTTSGSPFKNAFLLGLSFDI